MKPRAGLRHPETNEPLTPEETRIASKAGALTLGAMDGLMSREELIAYHAGLVHGLCLGDIDDDEDHHVVLMVVFLMASKWARENGQPCIADDLMESTAETLKKAAALAAPPS